MAGFGATLRPVGDQLIRLFGDGQTVELRRYELAGAASAGQKTPTLVDGYPIEVLAVVVAENVLELDTWEAGSETILISASEFAPGEEELTGRWTVKKPGGVEQPISGAVQPVQPGADPVYYALVIQRGAGGGR